eukprot:COSAG01_NODE_1338_length_10666_cov_79.971231_2_plen_578_part_00
MAGMVSVGIHQTYDSETCAACLNTLGVTCICVMGDLFNQRAAGWSVSQVLPMCPQLTHIVAMDLDGSSAAAHINSLESWQPVRAELKVFSFVDWVSEDDSSSLARTILPDPFEARGSSWIDAVGKTNDLATVLFTSGSSGKPKAVAVGIDGFVFDISGDKSEQMAISQGLTISYIPLSHSSDRYKVWQHCAFGGRVAFCHFAASNWGAHEQDKKDSMISYVSPIDDLFRQVRSAQPSSMALPPNIWAGLFQHAVAHCGYPAETDLDMLDESVVTAAESAAAQIAKCFGGKMLHLATGGAPTPPYHLQFAKLVARTAGATLVNSYGATECGAITADGRQSGPKFSEVRVRLVDRSSIGFTHADQPKPRGEVAVASPSLALGYFDGEQEDAFVFVSSKDGRPCPEWVKPALPDGRWYMTGDLADQDVETGLLTLIDRRSAVVSTKAGAIVRQGEIEAKLEGISGVRHALAHASPDWHGVAIVLSVDPAWVHTHGSAPHHVLGDIIEDPAVHLNPGIEDSIAWRVGVTTVAWTVQNGMLSAAMKKKRKALELAYTQAVHGLHSRGDRAELHGLDDDVVTQ